MSGQRVFISYSHKDKHWLDELRTMLAPAVRAGAVQVWWDGKIKPADRWREEIAEALSAAQVAVLLVSKYFLASKFIVDTELPYLIEAARKRRVKILWVLVSPCLHEPTPLQEIQALHDVARPLAALHGAAREAALKAICQKIAHVAAEPLVLRPELGQSPLGLGSGHSLMSSQQPEEFGYLLLKELTADPLGETFRARRTGNTSSEQVLLLRVFNGKGIDGEKLWRYVSGRGAVQQALRSPNIGSGVDLGRVWRSPYAAYDYISGGKSLSALLAQASAQLDPIPIDDALLIAERIALALAAAYETRVQGERVQHGFVVPQLVMVSNEGETRLLGFETAPGLRALVAGGWSAPELRPYLSPEAADGRPLARSDDVWSLGAILFELLTGEQLPAPMPNGYGDLIDDSALHYEDTPLPTAISLLLKKSLLSRNERITDVVTWHKMLSKLMIDSQYSPTSFQLAFLMHNRFRDEIERESQDMQAEKKLPH